MSAPLKPARVGILGGMGPAATADFYSKLVMATPANCDQDHLAVLMEADPAVPDRTEAFLHGGPSPLPCLSRGASALEQRGADLVVMPCNTAHLWHEAIARQLSIPLLHIVDAVIDDLVGQLGEKAGDSLRIGLLGTAATAAGRLYPQRAMHNPCASGWDWVLPAAESQNELEAGIAAVKRGDLPLGRTHIGWACDGLLQRGVDAVVFACTEVPLALGPQGLGGVASSDSTAALARLTVRLARREIPFERSAP